MPDRSQKDMRPQHCSICSRLSGYERGFQVYGREEEDTHLPAEANRLQVVRDLKPDRCRVMQLKQCPECKTYYLYKSDYEFLIWGSEDEQILVRLTDEATFEYFDWPALVNPLEARVKKSYYARVAFIGLFTMGLGALFMLFQHRRWVKSFDKAGVIRRDGQQFRWIDLKSIKHIRIHRVRSGIEYLNHIELVYKAGKAFVFPLMLENEIEVMDLLKGIPIIQPIVDRRWS